MEIILKDMVNKEGNMTVKFDVRNVRGTDTKDISIRFYDVKADLGWHDANQRIDLASDLLSVIGDLLPRETIVEMLSKYGYEVK